MGLRSGHPTHETGRAANSWLSWVESDVTLTDRDFGRRVGSDDMITCCQTLAVGEANSISNYDELPPRDSSFPGGLNVSLQK